MFRYTQMLKYLFMDTMFVVKIKKNKKGTEMKGNDGRSVKGLLLRKYLQHNLDALI